ncbi:MAG: lysophospholipid acyltransferase family protein [Gammaproteobacteria bacterium]|nr:lysophospholipid acyltransferase family protein [Gammaproteobacteria bacterium]NIR98374.1 lysophospholipid acyltransferase family protein [Gammaproteobacteria bacterium]NIT64128.1 lysophospholipid acyltransferase family protein [Gammaproteobacteria bacterium]NIV21065.1 lipid A biosynthesis acyltransferase [Gammaproteobacteria bacterium]NIY32708.1 lipid A biosynthesis acyltransferase [Gammaproteobacteria bacterium]
MTSAEPGASDYLPRLRAATLSPRHWIAWLGVGLLWVLTWMPWPVRAAVALPLGELDYRLSRKRRGIADVNLVMCFPHLSQEQRRNMLRRHFHCRMRSALDYGVLWWGSARRIRRVVRVRGDQHFRKYHEKGRPVILLTAHSLGLDFGAAVLTTRVPGVGLVKRARNPVADWLIQRGRTRFNARLVLREIGLRPVVRAVRRGWFFYYLPDEDMGGRGTTVFAPFFGQPAATLTALGRLAQMCDAVVVPTYTYYVPGTGRYEHRMFPALEDFPTGDAERDARRMNQELEKLIGLAPEQYMWTMRLFKTRPPGESTVYE